MFIYRPYSISLSHYSTKCKTVKIDFLSYNIGINNKEGFYMKVQIYGKNITVTAAIAEKIEKKLSHLEKYFIIDENVVANVVVRVYPNKQKIEVTIPTKYAVLRTEVVDDDLYAAIDKAIDKLEDQIRRQKTRLTRKNKEKLAYAFIEEDFEVEDSEDDEELVKTKSIVPDTMELDEAIMRMEMLNHNFFIYRDDETSEIAVVYKRHDGGYGLIETE